MCFYFRMSKTAQELQHRFNATLKTKQLQRNDNAIVNYNAFQFPATPVITNKDKHEIQFFQWGLIPAWAKNDDIRKHTLNARIETIHEKPSFKHSVKQQCLILADGFYEWQWLDEKGKQKQKYLITVEDNDAFAFAGLWNAWTNPLTGELINTYTILTTEANALMSEIHNSKKRMPFILSKNNEANWLNGVGLVKDEVELVAVKCS
jgi:putative SOS response-associated peptidase YedK